MLISLIEVSGKPSVSRSILIFFSAKIFRVSLSLALHAPPACHVTLMGGGGGKRSRTHSRLGHCASVRCYADC